MYSGTNFTTNITQFACLFLVGILLLALPASVIATPGDLDPSFDSDGITTVSFRQMDEIATAAAIQSDGKLIILGKGGALFDYDILLARYHPDGNLDNSFDDDGTSATEFEGNVEGNAITVQNDGKILVAGFYENESDYDFALIRFNSNGSLDTTFGGGDGLITTDFGTDSDKGQGMVLQTDGKIIVAGGVQVYTSL